MEWLKKAQPVWLWQIAWQSLLLWMCSMWPRLSSSSHLWGRMRVVGGPVTWPGQKLSMQGRGVGGKPPQSSGDRAHDIMYGSPRAGRAAADTQWHLWGLLLMALGVVTHNW